MSSHVKRRYGRCSAAKSSGSCGTAEVGVEEEDEDDEEDEEDEEEEEDDDDFERGGEEACPVNCLKTSSGSGGVSRPFPCVAGFVGSYVSRK
jgi:hypothetical protein